MIQEIFLAILQAATEFLPISSSGHLALASNLISEPNLFFFTVLHLASLIAVIIFTRNEIYDILKFDKESLMMIKLLIIATIPAALFGFFFHDIIEDAFSNLYAIGASFLITGFLLLLTKKEFPKGSLNPKNSLIIGLFQILALFPGISRSGATISSAMYLGIPKEKAAKFSFLLLIPLAIGAFILETGDAYFSWSLVVSFIVCLLASLLFLNLLMKVIVKNKFWMFGFYCIAIGILTLILALF